jgi:hypothetical protein
LKIEQLLARQDKLEAENLALKAENERAKKRTAQQQQGGGILIVAKSPARDATTSQSKSAGVIRTFKRLRHNQTLCCGT